MFILLLLFLKADSKDGEVEFQLQTWDTQICLYQFNTRLSLV